MTAIALLLMDIEFMDIGLMVSWSRTFGGHSHGRTPVRGHRTTNVRSLSSLESNARLSNRCLISHPNASTVRPASIPDALERETGMAVLTGRQRQILDVIESSMRARGYPPSVREIGE